MQKILIIILFFVSSSILAQYNKKEIIKDYNNDRIKDTLRSYFEGGSSFGGTFVEIINGKTKETFKLNNDGSSSQIKRIILVSEKLLEPKNKLFFEALKSKLLYNKGKTIDPSLKWILNGIYANKKVKNNPYFNFIIDPKTKWSNGKIKLPNNYYITISGDSLSKINRQNENFSERLKAENKSAILAYYANNHYQSRKSKDRLQFVVKNNSYSIFKTSHGVIAQKGNYYKWLFITDVDLTGAPDKLRWESIQKIKLIDNYLILQQDLPPTGAYNIYIINIETGLTGALKFDFTKSKNFNANEIGTFLIKENNILLSYDNYNDDEKLKEVKLSSIFNELEKQYIIPLKK